MINFILVKAEPYPEIVVFKIAGHRNIPQRSWLLLSL